MRNTIGTVSVLVCVLAVSGCIVSDQLTTITVNPDGSADLVVFRSNIRSTETGEQAEKELSQYKRRFKERTTLPEFARIQEAGGRIVEANFIRNQPPFSNVIHAHLPDARSLEKYGSSGDGEGEGRITTRFTSDGAKRRLEIVVLNVSSEKSAESRPSDENVRQGLANGISETRVAVTDGTITSSQGFTVAQDKQSALLELAKLVEQLQGGDERLVLFLEWEVTS